jgi:hypothetical protein
VAGPEFRTDICTNSLYKLSGGSDSKSIQDPFGCLMDVVFYLCMYISTPYSMHCGISCAADVIRIMPLLGLRYGMVCTVLVVCLVQPDGADDAFGGNICKSDEPQERPTVGPPESTKVSTCTVWYGVRSNTIHTLGISLWCAELYTL